MSSAENFTFVVISKAYGAHEVIAPVKFRAEIEGRTWQLMKRKGVYNSLWAATTFCGGGRKKKVFLHRFIMDLAGCCPSMVDHVDRDPLNNAEDNLRSVTYSQNAQNRSLSSRNTSGYPGVSLDHGRWRARVEANGRRRLIGYFGSFEEARQARRAAAAQLHGRFHADI